MKKTFLFLTAMLIVVTSNAQTKTQYMQVWANNRVLFEKGIETIDSITFIEKAVDSETGTIMASFSVNYDKMVYFSVGNLQYQASTDTWRFAEHQTDAMCGANANVSSYYDGWVDLFAWGTSGYDNTGEDPLAINFQPWASGTLTFIDNGDNLNTFGCGPSVTQANINLEGNSAYYDWGVYNPINNGGNISGMWRTLSYDEWFFLLYTRFNAQNLCSSATVEGTHGVILLPDDYIIPEGISWQGSADDWGINSYNSSEWGRLEALGAVFLPAAGVRDTPTYGCGQFGYYWTITAGDFSPHYYAATFSFNSSGVEMRTYPRGGALSVRLVRDVQ